MIEIEYSKSASKTISNLDKPIKLNIKEHIEGLTQTPPLGDIKPMQGYSDGRLRLRVGKYRIVYKYKIENNVNNPPLNAKALEAWASGESRKSGSPD